MCSGKLARWLILVLLNFCAMTTVSQAAPSINYSPAKLDFSPSGPYSVPRDTAVGSTLATASVSITASGFPTKSCAIRETATVIGTELPSGSGMYTTGVKGIGVEFYVVTTSGSQKITSSNPVSNNVTLFAGSGPLPGIEARLVVTGQVASGSMLSNMPRVNMRYRFGIPSLNCAGLNGGRNVNDRLSTNFSNNAVTPITCSVTTPSVSVTLPKVSTTSLSSVGQTSGDTRFNIGLSCQSGANVYVTLTDATTPTNTTSLLSLNPSSTAVGVNLRILKSDGNPVSFGPDSAVAGTTNQWLVGASASVNDIPLTVQYYRVGVLTPGTVNAAATFTMSYQ